MLCSQNGGLVQGIGGGEDKRGLGAFIAGSGRTRWLLCVALFRAPSPPPAKLLDARALLHTFCHLPSIRCSRVYKEIAVG